MSYTVTLKKLLRKPPVEENKSKAEAPVIDAAAEAPVKEAPAADNDNTENTDDAKA